MLHRPTPPNCELFIYVRRIQQWSKTFNVEMIEEGEEHEQKTSLEFLLPLANYVYKCDVN
jgi:hypothetical protein